MAYCCQPSTSRIYFSRSRSWTSAPPRGSSIRRSSASRSGGRGSSARSRSARCSIHVQAAPGPSRPFCAESQASPGESVSPSVLSMFCRCATSSGSHRASTAAGAAVASACSAWRAGRPACGSGALTMGGAGVPSALLSGVADGKRRFAEGEEGRAGSMECLAQGGAGITGFNRVTRFQLSPRLPVPAATIHPFMVPVSSQRWCQDSASGSTCGVCLP